MRYSDTEKRCAKCKVTKSIDEFVTDNSRADGRKSYCKVCGYQDVAAYVRARASSSLEERVRHVLSRARAYHGKQRGTRTQRLVRLDHQQALDLVYAQDCRCYYSGETLNYDGTDSDRLLSLDRWDNDLGYTPRNVVPCCWRVNQMKRDLNGDPFVRWARLIAEGGGDASDLPQESSRRQGRRWASMESAIRVKRNNAKQRAARSGLTFDLSVQELVDVNTRQGGRCAYSGVTLTYAAPGDAAVSIDRVDSSGGYTIDNVCLCCWRVNNMKGDLSVQEFRRWARLIADWQERDRPGPPEP